MRRRRGILLLVVALGLPGVAMASADAEPVDIAIAFVGSEPERFGVTAMDVADLAVSSLHRSEHNGVTHVYLQQQVNGLEVAGSSIAVTLAADGSVLHAGSRLVPDLDAAAGRVVLGPIEAASAARESLVAGGGASRQPVPAELVYQPDPGGGTRLAWRVEIEELDRPHWWNATVDAETGELLVAIDYTNHDDVEHTAAAVARPEPRGAAQATTALHDSRAAGSPAADGSSYRVFPLPLESPNDGDRELIENPADPVASPFGWHDTDGEPGPEYTITRGNNVHAYADWGGTGGNFNPEILGVGLGMGIRLEPLPPDDVDGGEDLTFDFPFDPRLPPHANRDASITNLFYRNNVIHDVSYRYGFDEVAGNFQVTNYGRGGIGGDDVQAEGQHGDFIDNAKFSTPPDGRRPSMRMYLWTPGLVSDQMIIDSDFDASVILGGRPACWFGLCAVRP